MPPVLQVMYWVLFALGLLTFISLINLFVAAARSRRTRKRKHKEDALDGDDLLWVFLVPALNEEVTIADSVSRLVAIEAAHTLVLVIDDGSEDDTSKVLDSLAHPQLRVLRRELPDAQRGKAAALNAGYEYVLKHVLTEERYAHWGPDRVIIGIVDADGRLDPHTPHAVAWHFTDPLVGGVQTLVRIYNRWGWLTWAQDVEFSAFAYVYQSGRTAWGTANMGGNGQLNRLSALETVADERGPWRDKLTEDQDLGIRLIQEGWKGAQENGAGVHQQGVPAFGRLLRQRVRWAQGALQALSLLRGIGRTRTTFWGRFDTLLYLLTPIRQLAVGLIFVATLVLAVIYSVPVIPISVFWLVVYLVFGLAPTFLTLLIRGRGWLDFFQAIVLLVPYSAYIWITFPALFWAVIRQLTGRRGWAKTAREPIDNTAGDSEWQRISPNLR